MSARPSIFYVSQGQDDNIGDVVLRRRELESLQRLGPVHVCVQDASRGFVEALELRPVDTPAWSFRSFVLAVAKAAVVSLVRRNRPVLFAFSPGELVLTTQTAVVYAALLPVLALVRLGGGTVVHTGVGLREWEPRRGRPVRAAARLATVCAWRDKTSATAVGVGDIAPDWAFGLDARAATRGQPRTLLAVSLRGDRAAPSDPWCEGVALAADKLDVDLVVVSQVRRDDPASDRLARRLGCEAVLWGDQSHAQLEQSVRDLYGRCRGIVSDRLHALVLGLVEGAIPVGAFESPDVKVRRHFDAAYLPDLSADVSGRSAGEIADFVVDRLGRGDAVAHGMQQARADLARLDDRIAAGVTSGPSA